ncbi:hypothetical protein DL768_001466 [Monosporascus sp. mg162]|nr:hypothetical protein DL768_001466 [Monosporascus sp. mg162]
MLFRGPIDRKATKQRSVVTSNTEVELVALGVAARNYLATRRPIKELQLRFHGEVQIQMFSDNRQTLLLLTSERPQATTKVKHVDIIVFGFDKQSDRRRSPWTGWDVYDVPGWDRVLHACVEWRGAFTLPYQNLPDLRTFNFIILKASNTGGPG